MNFKNILTYAFQIVNYLIKKIFRKFLENYLTTFFLYVIVVVKGGKNEIKESG